jgi:hypothetical protein
MRAVPGRGGGGARKLGRAYWHVGSDLKRTTGFEIPPKVRILQVPRSSKTAVCPGEVQEGA